MEHQPPKDRHLRGQDRRNRLPTMPILGGALARRDRHREEPLAKRRAGLHGALDPIVDSLEQARHHQHHRRPDFEQVGGNLRKAFRVCDRGSRPHAGVVTGGPFERMRDRQERKDRIRVIELQDFERVGTVGQEVAVRKHHALGRPGRTRRVDERREVVALALADGCRTIGARRLDRHLARPAVASVARRRATMHRHDRFDRRD